MTPIVYINGQRIDLDPGTVIALTYQAVDITDLTKRSAAYTNTFRAAFNDRNNTALGFSGDEKAEKGSAYRKLKARVVDNGNDVINDGIAFITSVDDFYNITIYSGVVDFFDQLKNIPLDTLDLGYYGTIDDAYLQSNQGSGDNTPCPVVNYGRLLPAAQPSPTLSIDPMVNVAGSGVDWVNNDVEGYGIKVPLDRPGTPQSKNVRGEFKFKSGFKYRVHMEVRGSGSEIYDITPSMSNGAGVFTNFANFVVTNSGSTQVLEATLVAPQDYNFYEIWVILDLTSTNPQEIRVLSISFELIEVGIDITAPYYLPTLKYWEVISKVFNSTNLGSGQGVGLGTIGVGWGLAFGKSKYEYSKDFRDQYNFNASAAGTQAINPNSLTFFDIQFPVINSKGTKSFYDLTSKNIAPVLGFNLRIKHFAKVSLSVTVAGGNTLEFYFRSGIYPTGTRYTITTSGTYDLYFEQPFMDVGQATVSTSLVVVCSSGSGPNIVNVLSGNFYSEIDSVPAGIINISSLILPNIKAYDFLRDVVFRFGLVIVQKSSQVYVRRLEDIMNDKFSAVDWTQKREVSQKQSLSFDASYAQENIFQDDSKEDTDARKSSIDIDNDNLEQSKTMYTSIMKASTTQTISGLQVVTIPAYDFESTDPVTMLDFESGPRLLYLRQPAAGDPVIKYGGVVATNYCVGVYNDPTLSTDATWRTFLKNYQALQRSLDQAKVITRQYNLKPEDIASLNLLAMVYDDGNYFIVNQVSNYVPGQKTTVQLFKVY